MKKMSEMNEAREPKPVHRIQFDSHHGHWLHSTNGGGSWKRVTPDEARAVHPARFKQISQDHGVKLVKESEDHEIKVHKVDDAYHNVHRGREYIGSIYQKYSPRGLSNSGDGWSAYAKKRKHVLPYGHEAAKLWGTGGQHDHKNHPHEFLHDGSKHKSPIVHKTKDDAVKALIAHHDKKYGNKSVKEDVELDEMSAEKLSAYAEAGRKDFKAKIKDNIPKSISRAKNVAKAERQVLTKTWNEDAPTNAVGGGAIAGADEQPPGPKSKLMKRTLRRVSNA